MRLFRQLLGFCAMGLLASVAAMVYSSIVITAKRRKTYNRVDSVPHNHVGLVPGCSRYLRSGRENRFFKYRIAAAAELFRAGKVNCLLVSGNSDGADYNEAAWMKNALVEQGIPESRIICDDAGFTTLDSVVRAKQVFGHDSITVVSQPFHNLRAIYIAEGYDLEAIGFNAQDVGMKWAPKTYIRELFARIRAVWDVKIWRRHPKFLDEEVQARNTALFL